jgi:hypothetical protein
VLVVSGAKYTGKICHKITKSDIMPRSKGDRMRQLGLVLVAVGAIAALGACGGSPSRYDPGQPAPPTSLRATPGDGQVTLAWDRVGNASAYSVYFSTAPGVSSAAGTKGPVVAATSTAVTALANGTRHYFVVTAINSRGESVVSNEVAAAPLAPRPFSQADLAGTWRFAVLSAGASAGWARGTIAVDDLGRVVLQGAGASLPYADSAGNSLPDGPGLFPILLVDGATGQVRNAEDPAASTLDATLGATNRNVIVGTASSAGTESIAILLKHDPAVTFAAGSGSGTDISGWGGGGTGGGARKVVYDQISTGAAPQEWEFAAGQIGQSSSIQYATAGGAVALPYLAPSNPPRPTDKTTAFAIDANGVVTETLTGVSTDTRPVFLLDQGFMSDDRTLLVGVGLSPNPSAPAETIAVGRHVLRVYHVTNASSTTSSADTTTGVQADLAGTWAFRTLTVATDIRSASGTIDIDAAGAVTFSSYSDGAGGTAPPGFGMTMLPDSLGLPGSTQFWGTLADSLDPTLHGKLSYDKDLFVVTRTEATGSSSFTIGLR